MTTTEITPRIHYGYTLRPSGRMVLRCDHRRRAYLYTQTDDPTRVTCPGCRRRMARTATRAATQEAHVAVCVGSTQSRDNGASCSLHGRMGAWHDVLTGETGCDYCHE